MSALPGIQAILIDIKDVTLITIIGKSTVKVLEDAGQFPKRISINNSKVVWRYADVRGWCELVSELGKYPPEKYYGL